MKKQFIKGVNLGGWFVLESWMKPALFEDTEYKDETRFMTHIKHAKEKLIKHYESFITEADFAYIKSIGLTSVRLPIPWWFQGDDIYQSSEKYIHQAMKWAETYQLEVLIDLHTAPGCQNGFDNGGIQGVMDWHKDPKHIDLTIEKLGIIVDTFKSYNSFKGIEVLNEPFKTIDMDIIIDFYLRSYKLIRSKTDRLIVFHDAFRPEDPVWKTFFTSNQMENIAFDLHLYHCFDPKLIEGTFQMHLEEIMQKRIPRIEKIHAFVDVIIGEWSLGIHYEKLQKDDTFLEESYDRILGNLQLYAYSKCLGYYFWNYKIERASHRNWDLKRLIHDGIFPHKL